jgi:hypothetical protein
MLDLMDVVRNFNTIEWSSSPIPASQDIKCFQLVEAIEALVPLDRPLGLDHQLSVRLQTFVFRMTELSVRARSPWVLETAAKALAMDGCVEREAISLLALVYRSAVLLGLEAVAVLAAGSRYGTAETRGTFLEYAGRSEEDKAIAKMGFAETTKEGLFAYQFDLKGVLSRAFKPK